MRLRHRPHPLIALACGLAALAACSATLTPFRPEVRTHYKLSTGDLSRIQFYVGLTGTGRARFGDPRAPALTLEYRATATQRETADASLRQRTVVTQKDFIIRHALPGVTAQSFVTDTLTDITIDVGSGALLTFRATGDVTAYTLVSINGTPYREGARVTIGGVDYDVRTYVPAVLLFNESNTLKVFKERIKAEGRRVR